MIRVNILEFLEGDDPRLSPTLELICYSEEELTSEAQKDVAYKYLDGNGKINFESGFITGFSRCERLLEAFLRKKGIAVSWVKNK